MDPQDAGREEFLRLAGRRYDQMMARVGSEGGETFAALEQQALAAARELAAAFLRQRLAREEACQALAVACPECGAAMRRPAQGAERRLETLAGTVRYTRRHALCDHCGASFSPSGPAPVDSAARAIAGAEPSGLRGQPGGVVPQGRRAAGALGGAAPERQARPAHHRAGGRQDGPDPTARGARQRSRSRRTPSSRRGACPAAPQCRS
jgi:hypothetical protein